MYQRLFGRKGIADGSVIDMAEHGRTGGLSTGQGFKFSSDIDEAAVIHTAGSVTYVAVAAPGTDVADPLWQVKKIDASSDTVITWADGNANFDNVATDLTSLSYV